MRRAAEARGARGLSGWARAALAEPLTHFAAIGLALFVALGLAEGLERPVVRISEAEIAQLAQYWSSQMQREPTRVELGALISERVDEEILAREALRLGLDRDDIIIRRRLAQKMAFISEDLGAAEDPDEATLRAHFAKDPARFAAPAAIAMRHVFFSQDRAGLPADRAAEAALARLRAGADPGGLGDPFLLPLAFAAVREADLVRDFGDGFASAVAAAPVGEWTGPVGSAYGAHVVRVEGRDAAPAPRFEDVVPAVREAFLRDARAERNAAFRAELRRRYHVIVELEDAPEGAQPPS